MCRRPPDVTRCDTLSPHTTLSRSTADGPGFSTCCQQNWGIGAVYRFDMSGGTTEIDLDYAKFDDKGMESEEAHARVDGEWDESEAERLDIDASDAETSFKVAHKRSLGAAQMEFGLDYRTKKQIGRAHV